MPPVQFDGLRDFVVNRKPTSQTYTEYYEGISDIQYYFDSPVIGLTVDWGDGTTDTWSYVNPSHTYSQAGNYTIKMYGPTGKLQNVFNSQKANLIQVKKGWGPGQIGTRNSFTRIYESCTGLVSIPSKLFKYGNYLYDFSSAFAYCSSLVSVPGDLFNYSTSTSNTGQFINTFYGCTALSSVPETLFDGFIGHVGGGGYFFRTFYGNSGYTGKLPELWVKFPAATNFQCFGGCVNATNYADAAAAGWT
jgi:hypothetical protein